MHDHHLVGGRQAGVCAEGREKWPRLDPLGGWRRAAPGAESGRGGGQAGLQEVHLNTPVAMAAQHQRQQRSNADTHTHTHTYSLSPFLSLTQKGNMNSSGQGCSFKPILDDQALTNSMSLHTHTHHHHAVSERTGPIPCSRPHGKLMGWSTLTFLTSGFGEDKRAVVCMATLPALCLLLPIVLFLFLFCLRRTPACQQRVFCVTS